ncbi:MAG: 5-formyltetrahydrofolate cyclo-ligase [Chlamydiae bacterium]|nr:5-formyltetrahydrofolate cyclo-ligase [Chlamydiota bacterium]
MKTLIRQKFREIRSATSSEKREEASLLALQKFGALKSILSFASFRDEIDLWPLNHHLAKKGELILPRIEEHILTLYRVHHIGEDLKASDWGILEPIPERCTRVSPEEIQYALVPGLAFDNAKHRIGYGKGYYDRLLSQLTSAIKIGIGFRKQLLNEPIPFDPTDHPLDELSLL